MEVSGQLYALDALRPRENAGAYSRGGSRDSLGDVVKFSCSFVLNLSHTATQPTCWYDHYMKGSVDITSQYCHHIDSTA